MKIHYEKLFRELKEELNEYSEIGMIPIKKLSGALQSAREALGKLKNYVIEHPFTTQEEEIDFFKNEKPRFVAEQLFITDFTMIQCTRPFYDTAVVRSFFEQELLTIRQFLKKHSFLYHYYQLGSTDMDTLFFVRGSYPKDVLLTDSADLDPDFSTACDHAWARFMAYERLQDYLLEEIQAPDHAPIIRLHDERNGKELKWTGETINLVEVAYGIWLTGQVNNGSASVSEIVGFLESAFRVNIGKAHRRWQSLAQRKRLAAFRYVDEMKKALEKRLEEEFER